VNRFGTTRGSCSQDDIDGIIREVLKFRAACQLFITIRTLLRHHRAASKSKRKQNQRSRESHGRRRNHRDQSPCLAKHDALGTCLGLPFQALDFGRPMERVQGVDTLVRVSCPYRKCNCLRKCVAAGSGWYIFHHQRGGPAQPDTVRKVLASPFFECRRPGTTLAIQLLWVMPTFVVSGCYLRSVLLPALQHQNIYST
jgi:hypothetical protein